MIKKRINKISRLVILIGARQIWKLLCNLYHLITQPFLTLKELSIDKDKSQIFLILMVVMMPMIAYGIARIIWDYYRYGSIINGVGMFFIIALSIVLIMSLYLTFWMIKVIRKK